MPDQVGFHREPGSSHAKKEKHNGIVRLASWRVFLKTHLFLQDFKDLKYRYSLETKSQSQEVHYLNSFG